jgi:uncharacterized protein with von Willebrand factor type A (vWA) domain
LLIGVHSVAFLDNVIAFGRLLRQSGLRVGTDRLITLTEALPLIDLGARDDVKAACRTLLIQRQEDIAAFNVLFDEFWRDHGDHVSEKHRDDLRSQPQQSSQDGPQAASGAESTEPSGEVVTLALWNDLERLSTKDFAALSADELLLIRSALGRLAWDIEDRRTRRWIAGRGSRIDLRRAMARSLRTGGEITVLPTRRRRIRPRSLVLLCDVSGSMEQYTRTLLLFAHTLTRSKRDVEAFLFATRLTRITGELRSAGPDAAMAAVSRAVRDWSGGTRIGEALRAFHQRWRRRTLHSSSVVILISDGWDRGDPNLLRAEIARLQRSCHRLIWLNPLIGTVDYAPLTRGLQAALPFVDDFLPVRTLRDVRDLALHLEGIGQHGRHRHLHLHRSASTRLGPDAGSNPNRVVHSGL